MRTRKWMLAAGCSVMLAAEGARRTTNSIGIALVEIPAGSFQMGVDSTPIPEELLKGPNGVIYDRPSNEGDYDEAPVHRVTISKPFLIGVTEVTAEQFQQFRPDYRANPYYAPYASGVSWNEAVAFCEWLSKKEGKPYRLPTEAEWEYAARGREADAVHRAECVGRGEHAQRRGGVGAWTGTACIRAAAQTDPVGPASGIARVIRGGGLDYKAAPKTDGGKHLPAEMRVLRALSESRRHGSGFRGGAWHRLPRGAGGDAEDEAAACGGDGSGEADVRRTGRSARRMRTSPTTTRGRCFRSWASARCARWGGRSDWRRGWAWRITIRRWWCATTATCWRPTTTRRRKRTIPTRAS